MLIMMMMMATFMMTVGIPGPKQDNAGEVFIIGPFTHLSLLTVNALHRTFTQCTVLYLYNIFHTPLITAGQCTVTYFHTPLITGQCTVLYLYNTFHHLNFHYYTALNGSLCAAFLALMTTMCLDRPRCAGFSMH